MRYFQTTRGKLLIFPPCASRNAAVSLICNKDLERFIEIKTQC